MTKLYNHFLSNGKKSTCEQNFIKSFKKLQKVNKKNHKKLVKSTIISAAPIIKMKQVKRKKKILKEFPYIVNKKNRQFISIKYVLDLLKTRTGIRFIDKFPNEIISISQDKNNFTYKKENDQKQIILKKKYSFFRWFY